MTAAHSLSGCELVSVSGAGRPRHHGLAPFQASIVDGNHPRVVPISASGRVVGIDQTCRAGLDSDPLDNLCARQIPLGHCDSLPNEKAPARWRELCRDTSFLRRTGRFIADGSAVYVGSNSAAAGAENGDVCAYHRHLGSGGG